MVFPKVVDDNYISDFHIYNLDKKKTLNKSGKLLLDFCKENSLRIVNGRTLGDLPDKYACFTYNGCSIVDYTIASLYLFQSIRTFHVNYFTPISDHCPNIKDKFVTKFPIT